MRTRTYKGFTISVKKSEDRGYDVVIENWLGEEVGRTHVYFREHGFEAATIFIDCYLV